MDLEETKKIIQNKIEADESAREVRSQIKSYIDQKQNLREGFTETLKPLIETSEAVKTSIDTQQNKLIKQLQDNQLALTEGLDKNRLAITSGFDKMDKVKKWDLQQLPGFEAIEEPELSEEKEPLSAGKYSMANDDLFYLTELEEYNKRGTSKITLKELKDLEDKYAFLIKDDYKIDYFGDPKYKVLQVIRKNEEEEDPSKRVITFDDTDLDSGLNNARTANFLKENNLPLPSRIKNESYKTIKYYQKKAENLINVYRKSLINKANFEIISGKNKAVPMNKNPRTKTLEEIAYYDILSEYVNNINKLENIAKKTGQSIIHFNNPQQLVNRLELLAGSIFAGNNGVRQEFSQIAHLLHQLKVITKKQLNDLLKKYILFK